MIFTLFPVIEESPCPVFVPSLSELELRKKPARAPDESGGRLFSSVTRVFRTFSLDFEVLLLATFFSPSVKTVSGLCEGWAGVQGPKLPAGIILSRQCKEFDNRA